MSGARHAMTADQYLDAIRLEIEAARAKFPGRRVMTIALAEEFGELCKAMLDESSDQIVREAVQVSAMAARVAIDGDETVDDWRDKRGLDRHPPEHPVVRNSGHGEMTETPEGVVDAETLITPDELHQLRKLAIADETRRDLNSLIFALWAAGYDRGRRDEHDATERRHRDDLR